LAQIIGGFMPQLQEKNIKQGFILLLIWCAVSAFSRVYTGETEQHLDPIALCFYITFFSSAVFFFITVKNFKVVLAKSMSCLKDVVGINIATVGCWLFLFYPLKFLEPSIVGALTLCITPLSTAVISNFIYRQQTMSRYDYIFSLLTFIMACYLIVIVFMDKSAVKHISITENIFSILCCFIVSISLAFSNIFSKKLSNTGFTPAETLTVRFIFTVFVSGIITLFIKDGRMLTTPLMTVSAIGIATLTVIIVPQLVYQSAIRELQPISVAMIAPLMPVMTFFIEFYDARLSPGIYTITGILIILGITTFGTILRYNQEKRYLFRKEKAGV
jgi:drug/metabolite transporter (DMT)-like permease